MVVGIPTVLYYPFGVSINTECTGRTNAEWPARARPEVRSQRWLGSDPSEAPGERRVLRTPTSAPAVQAFFVGNHVATRKPQHRCRPEWTR